MVKSLLLGIDIGTSGCKVTAFDFEGTVLGSESVAYETFYPSPGHVEQDSETWWVAACQGIRAVMGKAALAPGTIAAIGVDGTSWACLPVDGMGRPLRQAMLWLDRRAEKQAQWMQEVLGEELLIGVSGNPVDPAYITPKMLWLKEREPGIYLAAHKFLQSNAFIVHKLTGVFSQDYSQGYGFHFFNISNGAWEEKIADALGLDLNLVASLSHCHEVVGEVTGKAAEETGLAPGTPVVAGGLDAACSTLGAGVMHAGQTQEQGGQAGGMSIQVDRPLIHPKLILGFHVLPDQWLLQGGTVGGGGALRWFAEQLGEAERMQGRNKGLSAFAVMDAEAAAIGPGSDGLIFLPYMAGERSPIWDSRAKGVFFGLSYGKTRAHMVRALMEGVGFSLLHNLETAAEAGAVATELHGVGGAANSRLWTQIKADITGKVFVIPHADHATTLGSALLAGIGVGVYRDFAEAVARTVRVQRTHVPSPENNKLYRQYYDLYRRLYEALKDCCVRLHEIEETAGVAGEGKGMRGKNRPG